MATCSHQPSSRSDGPFVAGHCPQCLLEIALQPTADEEPIETTGETPVISFTPGTILGDRFRLVAMMGRGGMGVVYRADDLKLGQPVALKFLPPAVSQNPEAVRRLFGEVRMGREVAHPNVCRLYDLAEAAGQHFIVMEFIDGEDLGSLLARIGRLPRRKASEVARDICAGLAACHERQIVHGDLKPGNIMLDGKGRARITDFGLSTIAGTRPEDRFLAGTLAYMAPEQLYGGRPSITADVYALGLVLYEIFTGRRVHDVRTIEQLKAAMDTPAVPPSRFARVSTAVDDMIMLCLERKPTRRPQSAAEVAAAFPAADPVEAALAAGETPSPAMVAASGEVGDLRVRSGWLLSLVGMLGLLTAIGGAERVTAVGQARPRIAPEVLSSRANEIARAVAYPVEGLHRAYGFTTRAAMRSRVEPPNSRPAFFYRESAARLVPVESLRRIGPTDPARDVAGMVTVGLDTEGRLRFLHLLPADAAPPTGHRPFAWEKLFAYAALPISRYTPLNTSWIPPVPFDEKREWAARDFGSNSSVRAAAFRGYAVYFDVLDDTRSRSAVPAKEDTWVLMSQTFYMAILLISIVSAAVLARRNMRMGRSDMRGARRLAGWVLMCRVVYWAFSINFVGVADLNTRMMVRGFGHALFEAAQVWLAYVALEPFVRRRWPGLTIAWNRLLDGRVSDPLVGRDALIGAIFGLALVLVEQLRGWSALRLGLAPAQPHPLTLELLSSSREVVAVIFYSQARALTYAAIGLFLFLLLRQIVPNAVIAGSLWIVNAAVIWTQTEQVGQALAIAIIVAVVQSVVSLLVTVRFGFFASVVMFFVYLLLVIAPLTFDVTRWYAVSSAAPVLLVGAVLVTGFRIALARKPMFGRRILEA